MNAKYDDIGIDYNQTRKADPFLTEQLFILLDPIKDGAYLDIGCGTGNYTNELSKKGVRFIGIDPSSEMLHKAELLNPNISWKQGTAEKTGLHDNSMNGAIGSLTIHHWNSLVKGFSELHRVLKPDGTFVLFTSTAEQMKGYWLNHYFPKMLDDSILQMPSYSEIESSLVDASLDIIKTQNYNIHPELTDKFLFCGKQNPELYFDKHIRHGISSFSSLAYSEDVTTGLARLRADITSGKIYDVIQSYENNLGDYIWLVAKKR